MTRRIIFALRMLFAKPRLEHVRYIKTPSPDRLSKPLEMARKAGRDDLVKRLEALRP